MDRARIEMAAESEFEAVVINDDVERAAREIAALLT
jgi:guanylate kinase